MCRIDDEIYDHFLKTFPEFEDTSVGAVLEEDEMKNARNKERWREFMNEYENEVDDFNFGTLLRTDCKGEYEESNSIFAVRMQFYAIEIYRNKRRLNDWICKK